MPKTPSSVQLSDKHRYVLAILAVSPDGEIDMSALTGLILATRGPFAGLEESYLRYKGILRVIDDLSRMKFLTREGTSVRLGDPGIVAPVLLAADSLLAARGLSYYHRVHTLSLDVSEAQDTLRRFRRQFPEGLVNELTEAMEIYQKTQVYDSVVTKCGRCVEILVSNVNQEMGLVSNDLTTGKILWQFTKKEVLEQVSEEKGRREAFEAFASAALAVYSFRSKMGAHWSDNWWWGKREIAAACLILALHLSSLYVIRLVPKIIWVKEHDREPPTRNRTA